MIKVRFPEFFLFVAIFLFVLSPYTIWGKPGVFVAALLSVYAIYAGLSMRWVRKISVPLAIMVLISLWGVLISEVHGIGQLTHFAIVFALIVVFLASSGIWAYCQKHQISLDTVLICILLTIMMNDAIILLQSYYPGFRQFIGDFLIEAGNIDFTEGFKFRGLASSGGAALSVTQPIALLIALYLLYKRVIGSLLLTLFIVILFSSSMVIGRTGIVLMPVAAIIFLIFNYKNLFSPRNALNILVVFLVLIFASPILYGFVSGYFEELFGEFFINYSFEFLLKGEEGLEDEGTLSVMKHFLTVVPHEFPEIITGVGYYGEGYLASRTDSGVARMFMSVGYPLGLLFYACVFYLFIQPVGREKYLLWVILFVLSVAEVKETLLFSGYGSRMFLIILVFSQLELLKVRKFQ